MDIMSIVPGFVEKVAVAIVSFLLGIISTVIITLWTERRKRSQITYSKKVETPLTLAKDELKDKLKFVYQNKEIEKLFFYSLKIANTGKKTIKSQFFTCLFSKGAEMIDSAFPRISYKPEVGPVTLDKLVSSNEYRYKIDILGAGQTVSIDFLTAGNHSGEMDVMFGPNEETKFIEGDVTGIVNLEDHIQNIVVSIIIFFLYLLIINSVFDTTKLILNCIILPFLIPAFRSLRSIISEIVKKFQELSHSNADLLVNVGGSVGAGEFTIFGSNNIVSLDKNNSRSELSRQQLLTAINALEEILKNLDSPHKRKIESAIDDMKEELNKPEPDKDEIVSSLKRAMGYIRSIDNFAEIEESIKPHIKVISDWINQKDRL